MKIPLLCAAVFLTACDKPNASVEKKPDPRETELARQDREWKRFMADEARELAKLDFQVRLNEADDAARAEREAKAAVERQRRMDEAKADRQHRELLDAVEKLQRK